MAEKKPNEVKQREEPYDTVDECVDEAMGRLGPRCDEAGFPHEGKDRKACGEAQESALDNLRLLVMNDEDLWTRGPRSIRYPKARRDSRGQGYYVCEQRFKPEAEEELAELRKPTDDQAKEIANRLWEPFVQQFVEIPREKRVEATRKCKLAVDAAIKDMDKCLSEKWPFKQLRSQLEESL